jgi:hypothetical protein
VQEGYKKTISLLVFSLTLFCAMVRAISAGFIIPADEAEIKALAAYSFSARP